MESWSTCTSNCINENYPSQDQGLPPGFRFHPTDEELITHYLAKKIDNTNFSCHAVSDADLNKSEPWELPGKAQMGEKEWYFFSARDRKYPTGMRTNRATEAGYWKATGKDREVLSSSGSAAGRMVGMKKTLVFYRGRAPKGIKTNWVMHEYRNEGHKLSSRASSSSHSKDEWVVCRIFHKSPGGKKMGLSELRQGSLVTSDSGATLYATSLPALLDSPAPVGSSGGRSDQESLMLNALLHYNNSAIKSETTPYSVGSAAIFNSTSMASLVARSGVTTSIIPPYTSTTSTPSLTGSGHMSHNVGANLLGVPNQRASYLHSSQGVSSPNVIMSNTFNNRNSPHNVGTLTPSSDHNHQHHLSSMQYVNPTPYIDPLLSMTPTSLGPPLSRLPSDLDTFWLYSDRL